MTIRWPAIALALALLVAGTSATLALAAGDRAEVSAELQKRIAACWSAPSMPADVGTAKVTVRLTRAGDLAAMPEVERGLGQGEGFAVLAKSAVRAIQRCAPYGGLDRLAPYEDWQTLVIAFSPPRP